MIVHNRVLLQPDLQRGDVNAIFVSPEGLEVWIEDITTELYRKNIGFLAFDEVHTLPEW